MATQAETLDWLQVPVTLIRIVCEPDCKSPFDSPPVPT